MPSVADLVEAEIARAAQTVRAGAAELEQGGAVQLVRYAPLVVSAEVDDDAAHVELTVVEGSLRWFCTCAVGRGGAFCVHCGATAIAACRRSPVRSQTSGAPELTR
ncbi:hypothetical protein [Spongiactinospora sp. TRM90649]|uniref:hypothetical protein n=1 Tax=Spongiactinospora sp. TRM90649 TaxID=3031114 RepID=UPI0023F70BF0|nr:hypothetical protein [Spongiactinospora sp. TRM90649]MDF5754995.1 hypothetical protein [Spongiactinospora sp. TRM90649]